MQGWASGDAGQVGIEAVAMEEDGLRVVRLTDSGPAATAGVVAGDLVTRIDGASVKGLVLEQVFEKSPGGVGKKIRLEIMRQGEVNPLDITVTRGPILCRAVSLEVRVKEGKLVVTSIGQWPILDFEKNVPITVVPTSNNGFFVNGGHHTRIGFLSEGGGKVTGVVLNPGPWQITGKRINWGTAKVRFGSITSF